MKRIEYTEEEGIKDAESKFSNLRSKLSEQVQEVQNGIEDEIMYVKGSFKDDLEKFGLQ